MSDRYLVISTPTEGAAKQTPFTRKGLAFAYAQRMLPSDLKGCVDIQFQMSGDPTPAATLDEKTGLYWTTVDTWKFHSDGAIDHIPH